MDYSKPTLLVISGPNGAGKSTHIESMLPTLFEGVLPFICLSKRTPLIANADETVKENNR